jgi:predicted MPP superfamily phosphohydrolase
MGLIFVFTPIALIFLTSQIYWLLRAWDFLKARTGGRRARAFATLGLGTYGVLFAYNLNWLGRTVTPTRLTVAEALLGAPFQWWVASSMVAFLVALLVWLIRRLADLMIWSYRRVSLRFAKPPAAPARDSATRRVFLERAAAAAVAAPFVAGAYGLLYGRLNLETVHRRIRLPRLPEAFEGFRIAQLSDIHIGPFMSEDEIGRYVRIANALRPDLTVLTGDFVIWDPSTEQAAVHALSGLRAPFGVFGCLGNHDAWARVEDSITRLFAQAGIRILRQARVPIAVRNAELNLIGVDFQSSRYMRGAADQFGRLRPLQSIEALVSADTVNVLMSHNPDTFDRAAALGIDLSLAGHTHGGQVSLEFISPGVAPSRLVTPYVSGWFEKPGGQLYVNRGIGTIGVPIRVGAPPEITVFELTRRA